MPGEAGPSDPGSSQRQEGLGRQQIADRVVPLVGIDGGRQRFVIVDGTEREVRGGRHLLLIARDHHPLRAQENRQSRLHRALRRLVQHDEVEQGLSRKQDGHGLGGQQPDRRDIEETVRGEAAHEGPQWHDHALLPRFLEQLFAELLLRSTALAFRGGLDIEEPGVVEAGEDSLDLELGALDLEVAKADCVARDVVVIGAGAQRGHRRVRALQPSQPCGAPRRGHAAAPRRRREIGPCPRGGFEQLGSG